MRATENHLNTVVTIKYSLCKEFTIRNAEENEHWLSQSYITEKCEYEYEKRISGKNL